jgi:hypothetical protein
MFSYDGSSIEYYYSQHLHAEHSAHTNSDNEYSFQAIYHGNFHSNLNNFIITLFILHLLLKANLTGQLLEVQLLRDLFHDRRHLL